jgi:tetratricopeptide (TPR) repeat protein
MNKHHPNGNEEPKGWHARYGKIVELGSFPVHVLVAVIGVLELIRSEGPTLMKLVGAGLVAWGWFYFFRIRTGKSLNKYTDRLGPTHSPADRRRALLFMIAIPSFAALYFAFWHWFWPRRYVYFPPNTFVVALANFEGPEESRYGVTEILRDELDKVAQRYPGILVKPLGANVSSQQGSEFARAKGQELGAALVVWGWYRVTSQKALLSAHVELIRQPQFKWVHGGRESREVAVADLESFDVQTRQANDMTYLALLAAAEARFEGAGNLRDVLAMLNEALAQQSAPEQIAGLEYGYFFRCSTYYYLEDLDKAQSDCQQAVQIDPHFGAAWANLAAVSFSKGDLDAALNESNQAIEEKPDVFAAYVTRAAASYRRGDYNQAEQDLDRAIKMRPDSPNAHDLRGLVYTDRGNFEAAIAEFNQAIDLDPGYAIPYNNRGNAYAKAGRLALAIDDYDRALKINPSYPQAYNDRGYAYAQQHKVGDAIRDYRKALSFSPNYLDAILNLAIACEQALDRSCAVANYETALKLPISPQQRALIEARLKPLQGN